MSDQLELAVCDLCHQATREVLLDGRPLCVACGDGLLDRWGAWVRTWTAVCRVRR